MCGADGEVPDATRDRGASPSRWPPLHAFRR